MTNLLTRSLESSISDRRLLSHPFYQRWEAGALAPDDLRLYAEQYRYFEEMLPQFLIELAVMLPEGVARDSVLKNLADEVTEPSHLELFERFANFYEASNAPRSHAMQQIINAYFEILSSGASSALAGLWAYECQGASIADSKAGGLIKFYGASDDATAFWLVHGSLEGDHAKWTLGALDALEPEIDEVNAAARLVADAWWSFLDEREALAA